MILSSIKKSLDRLVMHLMLSLKCIFSMSSNSLVTLTGAFFTLNPSLHRKECTNVLSKRWPTTSTELRTSEVFYIVMSAKSICYCCCMFVTIIGFQWSFFLEGTRTEYLSKPCKISSAFALPYLDRDLTVKRNYIRLDRPDFGVQINLD